MTLSLDDRRRFDKASRGLHGQRIPAWRSYVNGMAELEQLLEVQQLNLEQFNRGCDLLLERYDREIKPFERHYDKACGRIWAFRG